MFFGIYTFQSSAKITNSYIHDIYGIFLIYFFKFNTYYYSIKINFIGGKRKPQRNTYSMAGNPAAGIYIGPGAGSIELISIF